MTHYRKHLFFCTNQRLNGKKCCQEGAANEMREFAKQLLKSLGILDVRVNAAGCLGRCELGPNIVIYPEGVWYTYHNEDDVKEIIEQHVIQGNLVERLQLQAPFEKGG